MELQQATPAQIREAVDNLHQDIRIPSPSAKFPKGERVIPWETLQVTDRLALLGGFRVSEVCTKYKTGGNTSKSLSLEVTEHKATGEEVLLIKVNALKKKAPVEREFGIPLKSKHEPWSKLVLDSWEKLGHNPCELTRQSAWSGNRKIFKGLGYKVRSWIEYERGEDNKILRDENGKKKIKRIIPEHLKPGGDHILRHIRTAELRRMQLSPEERANFYKWSPVTFGGNPLLDTYDNIDWFEYFPKLLKS